MCWSEEFAEVYCCAGRFQLAAKFLNDILVRKQAISSTKNVDTLRVMGNLATIYSELGLFKDAEALETTMLEKRIAL